MFRSGVGGNTVCGIRILNTALVVMRLRRISGVVIIGFDNRLVVLSLDIENGYNRASFLAPLWGSDMGLFGARYSRFS